MSNPVPAPIPANYRQLLEAPVHVVLATLMPDGQPQLTLVWSSCDGEYIYINTARGRQKEKNMTARPQVTLFSADPRNPGRWIEVRGRVVEMTEEGAVDHINALAQAYDGTEDYFEKLPASRRAAMVRVICKIEPVKVNVL
ncbi:MAG: PPOX class F420-dependent oxidoreductase [Anaerolineales bacterium]|nr:PPOX class F420-dependent oxidoreductase [Anaerolineales bacterium]